MGPAEVEEVEEPAVEEPAEVLEPVQVRGSMEAEDSYKELMEEPA